MQTISLFPHLFDYQMLGIFALRVTLGLIFIYFWYEKVTRGRMEAIRHFGMFWHGPVRIYFLIMSSATGLTGVFLIIGLYTQGAAIVAGLFMLKAIIVKCYLPSALPKNTTSFYVLLAVVSFALLFLGPGAFAVDLPL